LFDDEARFYREEDPTRYYQQGDIVLAPVGLFAPGTTTEEVAPPPPPPGESLIRQVWQAGHEPEIAAMILDARVMPALITTHDCTLDRDYNRRFHALRRNQIPKAEAAVEAAADPTLDPYLTVSPLIPVEDAAPSSPNELLVNKVVGFFPICPSESRGIDLSLANLVQEVTIERSLIIDRLGILSDDARAVLRYAIARFWVYRAPKLTFEIEQAVGKRIVNAQISPTEDLAIELQLSDGETLRFVQGPQPDPADVERPVPPA
jgi:hypothetical protein